MDIKHIFLFLFFFCSTACNALEVGIVQTESDGETYLYFSKNPEQNEKIYFQHSRKDGMLTCCSINKFSDFVPVQPNDLVMDSDTGDIAQRYKLIKKKKSYAGNNMSIGIAIAGNNFDIHQINEKRLSINFNEKKLNVISCLSTEGVHIITMENIKVVADLYYGLGYSVDKETCNPDYFQSK